MTERVNRGALLEKAQKPLSWSVGTCYCCALENIPITPVERNDSTRLVSLCALCVQIPGAPFRTLTRQDLYKAQSIIYQFLITRVGMR